jgi:hypothetical protein
VKRKLIVAALLLVLSICTWIVHEHFERSRHHSAYQAAIAPLEHDLAIGMDRTGVQQYLHVHNIQYHSVRVGGSDGERIEIRIGEEPGSLVCDPWQVYAALEFSPQQTLTNIHVVKVGTCL